MSLRSAGLALLLATLALAGLAACDGDDDVAPTATTAPDGGTAEATPDGDGQRIETPEGFTTRLIAEGLSSPTRVTVDGEGGIWVTEDGGRAYVLVDGDGDGFLEEQRLFVEGLDRLLGMAFGPDGVYFSYWGNVAVARDEDGDGAADVVTDIISGLPSGVHQNNGIAFGPDGKLYVGLGSTCNECEEEDERSATILQANPDGSELRVFARGLRNPYDIFFTPDGRLWSTDNGSDPPCNTVDEFNLIVEGGDYGWPYEPECDSLADGRPPVASLGFNTASTGLTFYNADAFPEEYRGSFFATLWGSLPFAPAESGRVLVRIVVDDGEPPAGVVEDFATGFERPIDVTVDVDGSLLVLDFETGRLYRITYEG